MIASGFIAGGAIMGVVSAFIIFFGKQFISPDWTLVHALGSAYEHWTQSSGAEILGFVMFVLLSIYMYKDAMNAKSSK